jgi:hypothetical protein
VRCKHTNGDRHSPCGLAACQVFGLGMNSVMGERNTVAFAPTAGDVELLEPCFGRTVTVTYRPGSVGGTGHDETRATDSQVLPDSSRNRTALMFPGLLSAFPYRTGTHGGRYPTLDAENTRRD